MTGQSRNPEALRAVAGVGPGDVIADKYRIDSVLGVGGMGIVFLASHLELDGPVALKFLSAECLSNAQAIGRFRREAQAAVKLRNEHVVRVFDVGLHSNGLPYIVMEYLEGHDLADVLASSGPLPIEVAADILIQTCAALSEAHGKGIIHRDLKPSNLFCLPRADGGTRVKVVDFGISKVVEGISNLEQGLTATGHVMGSPSYMSPEQMKTPHQVDHRTDIWSLGVVLFESLTGNVPFPASTYAEICLRVHQDPPSALRAHRPDLPQALEQVILKCLEKDPGQRFDSAAALARALSELAAQSRLRPTGSPLLASSPAAKARASQVRSDTLTLANPNWEKTADAFGPRIWRGRLLGFSVILLVCAGALWLVGRHGVTGHNAAAGAEVLASPSAPAELPSVVVNNGASAPSPEPSPALGESATALNNGAASPNISGARVSPTPLVAHANPASSARATAQPKVPSSAAAHNSKPHTERDPKSSTWTR